MKTWNSYNKSTINDACKKLPVGCRKLFKDLFKETNCADVYGGELDAYIRVIKQVFRRQKNKLEFIKNKLKEIENHKE